MLAPDGDSIWTLKRHLQPLLRGGVYSCGSEAVNFEQGTNSTSKDILELETSIYKWLFQLDNEPNLLHRKLLFNHLHPFETGCLGFQVHSK